MSFPNNYMTVDRIIRDGARDACLLQDGDDPSSEQYANWLNRLNDVLMYEQTQGLKLFLLTDLAIPLVANQPTYVIGPGGDVNMVKPLRVISGYYLDQDNNQRPLDPLSWDEYTRLSRTTEIGSINSYFVNKQTLSLNVSFWNNPDVQAATGVAHLITQLQQTGVVQLTDTVLIPVEWAAWAHWALADEICNGQPDKVQEKCAQKVTFYRAALQDWDVEDADTSFQPDSRQFQNAGRFL